MPVEETSFMLRDGAFNVAIVGRWVDPADGAKTIAWAKQLQQNLVPYSSEAIYVNYANEEQGQHPEAIYGAARFRKLGDLKRKYDPDNVFRLNVNIKPAH